MGVGVKRSGSGWEWGEQQGQNGSGGEEIWVRAGVGVNSWVRREWGEEIGV